MQELSLSVSAVLFGEEIPDFVTFIWPSRSEDRLIQICGWSDVTGSVGIYLQA